MELLTHTETARKMGLITAAYEAVERAREEMERRGTASAAVEYQQRRAELAELRGTLPKPRLV